MNRPIFRILMLFFITVLLLNVRSHVFGEVDNSTAQSAGVRTEKPNPFLAWPLPHVSLTSISRLPDTAWTHNFLGITDCPPYPALIDAAYWPYSFSGNYNGNRQVIKSNIPDDRVKWQNRDNLDAFNNAIACYGSNGSLPDHVGTDIFATNGTEVLAAAQADQIDVRKDNVGQYRIRLRHPNVNGTGQTWYTYYVHLSGTTFSEGTNNVSIQTGTTIGYVGSGHLHFEVSRGPDYSISQARNPWGIDNAPYDGCLWIDSSICPTVPFASSEGPKLPSNGHFSDVLSDDWRLTYIETLYFVGAINGFSDGTFRPDNLVTRAEAAKMIIGGMERKPNYTDGLAAFPDVPSSHTFYQYIRDLKELNITIGYSDGTYRPDNTLTRCESAAFIVRARGETPNYSDNFQPFSDIPPSHACYQNTRHLYELGISFGYSDGTFKPDLEISRGSLTVFIVRGLRLLDDKPEFNDVLHEHIFYDYIQSIYSRGITNGCDSSLIYYKNFCPNEVLPREQAAAFISRAMGAVPYYTDGRQSFPDVNSTNKFYHHIEHLYALEIVSGYSDGTFKPGEPISRGQFAKMVALGIESIGLSCPSQHTNSFPDVPPGSLWYEYVQCLKDLQISSGFSDGLYHPDDSITRAEAAKFMDLAFVQKVLTIEQEPEEIINDSYVAAPPVELIEEIPFIGEENGSGEQVLITLPNDAPNDDLDEDWMEIEGTIKEGDVIEITATELGNNLLPVLNVGVIPSERGTNLAYIEAIALNQENAKPESSQTTASQPILGSFVATVDGTYYLRIENANPFAIDGVNIRIGAQRVLPYSVYLPMVSD